MTQRIMTFVDIRYSAAAARAAAILLLAAILVLTGCASESYQRVAMPADDSSVGAASSRLFVIRSEQFAGSEQYVYINCDGRDIGRLAANDYLCWDEAPGKKVLQLLFERTLVDGGAIEGVEGAELAAGEVAYYELRIQDAPQLSGMRNGLGMPRLVRLSESEGTARVASATPAPFDPER